jgi:hypothetical protein
MSTITVRRYKFKNRRRGRQYNRNPYGLPRRLWNDNLAREFDAYQKWCIQKLNLRRPPSLRQRPTTFKQSVVFFENYFGYLVNARGEDPVTLLLARVVDLERVEGYVMWHAEQRASGPSRHTQRSVGIFSRVARYYLKTPVEQWMDLDNLRKMVTPAPVYDKRQKWVTLIDLEKIGLLEWPTRQELKQAQTAYEKKFLAFRAQHSLFIRLLVRRPLRSRNIREMTLGKNLYQSDGQWLLEFQGEELKVGKHGHRMNVYKVKFPRDLVTDLNEFLNVWRPLLPGCQRDQVFTTWTGQLYTHTALSVEFRKTVYAYTERATNIHLVRDIWATEFLIKTQDFITAADMLGDRVETVLARYAHLRRVNAGEIADHFIRGVVARFKRKDGKRKR